VRSPRSETDFTLDPFGIDHAAGEPGKAGAVLNLPALYS
jgi:hypothetical protein